MKDKDVEFLFEKISRSRHCIALTGAGVSTFSGLPDFRGEGGLYGGVDAELDAFVKEEPDLPAEIIPAFRSFFTELAGADAGTEPSPAQLFDIEYFERDPSFFYKAAASLIYAEREPSLVHKTLAVLEGRGCLKAVITQNVDLLHQRAGSRRVIEVHGSPRIHYCLRCAGIRMDFAKAAALVRAGDMPRCPHCGRVLKPAITFFGERLPMEAVRAAGTEAWDADLMLILGTSLKVSPAADLPRTTLRRGGELVIVNNMITPLDDSAVLHFDDLGRVFEGLNSLLSGIS
ncbi:MAG: NAD-dependent deacetylase [Treponema sp.]|nr:NAD-dependent deacetylase [Treponema sp.]